jgi:peptidoglycan hydrolase-like protein with peptidoglycan-binding domain
VSDAGPHAMRRKRRLRWVVVGVAVVAVLGVGTVVGVTRFGNQPTAEAAGPAPAETAEVTKVDLAERKTSTGQLGYGAEQALTGKRGGTITWLPAQGAVFERGAVVYHVDARPVVLFNGELPMYRDVGPGVTDGPDVRLIEQNLADLGFGGFGKPNEKFTAATENAIKRWQKSLKQEQTGIVTMGDVVVTPGPVRASSITATLGADGAGEVLKYTPTTRAVTVELDAEEQDLAAPGTKVALTVGGQQVTGTVTGLTPKPADEQDPSSKAGFTASIAIDDLAAIGAVDSGSVEVVFTTGAREGVLAVPVGALLALAEGGYAVEVVEGGKRRLIAVTTGLFANDLVEVSGEGLRAGLKVVTTS